MKRILLVVVLLILQLSVCGLYGQSEREKERTLFKKKLGGASGKERIEILSQLSRLYYDDYKLRIQYCEEALKLMETLGEENPELKVELVTRLSEAYGTIGRQTDGFKYMWEAIALYRQLDNKAGLSSAYTSLSYLYRSIDRLDESLKWILKASKLDDETGGYSRFTISLGMGYLYNSLGQYEDSLESLQTALDIAEASKEKMSYIRGKAHVLIAIGLSYRGQGKNLKALDTFFRALEIYLQLENSSGIITASINIANTYNAVGEYKKALANLEKALELAQQKNDKNKICYCYLYLGDVYSNMKKYTESETYYKQAGELAAELKRPNRTQLVYVGLSELEAGRGNYQKALDYYKKYVVIKDSLEVQKNSEQAAELQVRYDFENQTIKISALQKQTDLQGIIRNGLLVVLALILIILGLMFKKYLYLFAFWKKQKYIGQYRLLESIGVGGMGNVFKAHNVRDKEKISAIKVLKDELFKKENNRKRFRQEGTIIDKLVHPHIIRIFERGEYEDKLYIVMEYLEGRTLADAIEEIGEKLP
ncbi:MAG: tetratricopeptide repeat protein, partial [bacterium]|nr:tetratricopeptide repeat protein [bacterium]